MTLASVGHWPYITKNALYYNQLLGAVRTWELVKMLNKYSGGAVRNIYWIIFNYYCQQVPRVIGLGLVDVSLSLHNTTELTMHTSCHCILDLLCVTFSNITMSIYLYTDLACKVCSHNNRLKRNKISKKCFLTKKLGSKCKTNLLLCEILLFEASKIKFKGKQLYNMF